MIPGPTYYNTQALSISSKVLIVLSNCPSDWGWENVLRHTSVPNAYGDPCQNLDINLLSRSDTMLRYSM